MDFYISLGAKYTRRARAEGCYDQVANNAGAKWSHSMLSAFPTHRAPGALPCLTAPLRIHTVFALTYAMGVEEGYKVQASIDTRNVQ